ncbi:BA71V-B263R [Elysia marginata]|uniref:BA71V-B263R n=1 Tax=Elysia marginata TaxID=1093978 RepID=A0AAV4GR93_9GAST|nr:BA71V-B263R [Elysia marginata]
MATDKLYTPEDEAILERTDPPFSPLTMFVCTFEAVLTNINLTHEALIELLEPKGAIKALNCNFGHKVQPGYERFGKKPKPAREVHVARGGSLTRGRQLTPAVVRLRKPQGDATCFNSALEVTIIPGPEDNPPAAVQKYLAQNPNKHYAVKSFPTTGKTQVPGVVCASLEDGSYVARLWAKFLTEAGIAANPEEPITVARETPIMLNFKYFLYRRDERVILNLSAVADHLETAKSAYEFAERTRGIEKAELAVAEKMFKTANRDAWSIYEGAEKSSELPFPVREIKRVQDGQNISFKFVSPAGKKVRVNMFYRGKVNILGSADFETPKAIYAYLSALVSSRWEKLVSIQPLPDQARRTHGASKPKPKSSSAAALPGSAATATSGGDLNPPENAARASEDATLDKEQRQDIENDQENPLDGDAK